MGYLVYFGRKYTTQNDKERISYLLYTKKRMNTRIPTKKAAFYNLCCTEFYKYLCLKRFWKGVRGEPFPQKGSPREIIFD
jgi:hypothetical protein